MSGIVKFCVTTDEAEVIMMLIWYGIQLLEDGCEACRDPDHWYTREVRRRQKVARPLYDRLVEETGTDGMNHLRR